MQWLLHSKAMNVIVRGVRVGGGGFRWVIIVVFIFLLQRIVREGTN